MIEIDAPRSTKQLIALHEALCKAGQGIMQDKNSDYANPDKSADPFRNFRIFGAYGILVRISDKTCRLQTFLEKAKDGKSMQVLDESWEDTILDAINYLVLLDGYIRAHGPTG